MTDRNHERNVSQQNIVTLVLFCSQSTVQFSSYLSVFVLIMTHRYYVLLEHGDETAADIKNFRINKPNSI